MLTCCLLNRVEWPLFGATVCPISLKGTSMVLGRNTETSVWCSFVSQLRPRRRQHFAATAAKGHQPRSCA